jgi:hypothetical protein
MFVSSNQLDSTDRWPSGLRRQLKVISSGYINNRWSERAWVQIPLCSTYLLPFVLNIRVCDIGFLFHSDSVIDIQSHADRLRQESEG